MSDPLSGGEDAIDTGSTHRSNRAAPTPSVCNCSGCLVHELNLCAGVKRREPSSADWQFDTSRFTSSAAHTISARCSIIHPKEISDFVLIVCHGWATRSIMAPDGHRQILSFLLPGDLISATNIFGPMSGHSVDAITNVIYRKFKQIELKAAMFDCPALLEKLAAAWIDERAQADQLALNVGRKSAHQRVASLILNLAIRLAKRQMIDGETIDFPLRQQHIADATGLTHVYVGKVLGELQRAGVVELSNRSLRIVDKEELHRAAGWQ